MADVKETRSVPSWVNEERAFDVSAFKVNINFVENFILLLLFADKFS